MNTNVSTKVVILSISPLQASCLGAVYRTKDWGIIRLSSTRLIGPLAQVRGAQKRLDHKTNPLLHHHPTTPHNLSTTPSIISYGTPINKHHKHYEKQVPSFKKQVEKLTSISTLCIPPQTLAGTYLKVFL
jgi:hypothetical protein